jgi:hypothetical protein
LSTRTSAKMLSACESQRLEAVQRRPLHVGGRR